MTRSQFVECMAYLEAGCGVPLDPKALQVYFDLLGDLEAPVLRTACKRVILGHPWKTFPSIAELRQASADCLHGQLGDLSPGEAWALAWEIVGRIDPAIEGSSARAMEGAPRRVIEALKAMGIPAMCYGKEPVGVLRGQFMKIYDGLASRDKRSALMPKAVKEEVKKLGGEVEKRLASIGRMDE